MLRIPIPRGEDLHLKHLVADVNGTLSDRGRIIPGVEERLRRLSGDLQLHVLSADTFGTAEAIAEDLGARLGIVRTGVDKRAYVEQLTASQCVAMGNGANDAPMFEVAGLSIAILGAEGSHFAALAAATLVARSVLEALDLLLTPQALTATLRR